MNGSRYADYERWRAERPEIRSSKAFDALCYAPFVSLLLDPKGDVQVCCQSANHSLGNVADRPLSEIWRGAALETFRATLVSHEFPTACASCQWEIERSNFEQVFARTFDGLPVASARPEWPLTLWFALNNACNLECVQCCGELSSSIRKNRDGLPPLQSAYGDAFFSDLRTILPHLAHAVFLGGEAFLARENFRIWDMMIEEQLRFPIMVVTNGTVFNQRVERVLDQLPCTISVSLDGATAATVEAIRLNARFNDIMANLEAFRRHTTANDTELVLSFCLMPQNHHELADFLMLAEEKNCAASVNVVYEPAAFSMRALGPEELRQAAKNWERRDAEMQRTLTRHLGLWNQERDRVQRWLDGSSGQLRRRNRDRA